MKKVIGRATWVFIVALFFVVSCKGPVVVKSNPQQVPPGQMKKATGSQSAKPYAPGQQKK
jgi:hypothetical protein